MKSLITFIALIFMVATATAQVGINTDNGSPDPSAMLDVRSVDKGILVPRMSSLQRTAISNAATGLLVFDTDTGGFWFYTGTVWQELASGGATDRITDADADTGIQVEESTDEDIIRFDVNGSEIGRMDGKTFHLSSPGFSLFMGENAGANDDGTNNLNTYFGYRSGTSGAIGFRNTFMGYRAGENNVSSGNNTFIGAEAGRLSIGGGNTFLGSFAGQSNTQGEGGIFIGEGAGDSNTTGDWNTYIGVYAGGDNTAGSRNTIIGRWAGATNSGSGNIFLGDQAAYNESGSNRLYIENSNSATPLIYGEFDNDLLRIHGTLDLADHNLVNGGTVNADTIIGDGSKLTNVPGDDLGSHTAIVDVNLNNNWLSNGTANTGLKISNNGKATLRTNNNETLGLELQGGDSPALRFYQDGSQWPAYVWDITGNESNFFIRDVSGGSKLPFKIKPGSDNDRVVIKGTQVGIGTETPEATLDVNGQIRMRAGASAGYIPVSDGSGVMIWSDPAAIADNLGNHVATDTLRLDDQMITNGNSVYGIHVNDNGTVHSTAADLSPNLTLETHNTPYIRFDQTYDGGWAPYTWDLGGHEQYFLLNDEIANTYPLKVYTNQSNNRLVLRNDAVGIGIDNPSSTLDVNGQIRMRAGAGVGYIPVSDANGVMTWTDPEGFADNLGNHTATANLILDGHWLSSDGSNKGIYVASNGDVGLGTSVPDAAMHIRNTVVGDSSGLKITQAGYNSLFYHNDIGELVMRKLNQTDQLVLGSAGNVGVGTTGPSEKLDVNGKIRMRTGATTGYIPVSDANGVMTWTNPSAIPADNMGDHSATQNIATNGYWISKDGDSEGIRFGDDGQVRIGPDAPTAPLLSVVRSADDPAGYPTIACYVEGNSDVYSVMVVRGTSGSQNVFSVTNENSGDVLVAEAEGHVGIGTSSPGYPLHVIGNAAKTTGALWTTVSDRRLKHDIRTYDEGLSEILKLNPVFFKYNEKSGFDIDEQHIGLVAQEVQEVAPHMISEFEKDGETYLDVNASSMLYMMINAFKELESQNNDLQDQINDQAAMIIALQEQVNKITVSVAATMSTEEIK